jgi:quercetin 2,3-dioxygenase
MDDPRYGTEPPENIPVVSSPSGSFVRVLAGDFDATEDSGSVVTGPFKTVQPVVMLDYTLLPGDTAEYRVPTHLDNVLVYMHTGSGEVNGANLQIHDCARLDAKKESERVINFTGGAAGASFLVFAGKMLNQPIAWHGPFVMTTDAEIRETLREYQQGTFLKKRASWDYKRIATRPASGKNEETVDPMFV